MVTLAPKKATPVGRVKGQRSLASLLVLGALVVAAALFFAPFILVLINAFKTSGDYATNGPLSLPSTVSVQGVADFWNEANFGQKLLNSLIISSVVGVGAVLLSLFNAYGLGIGRVRGRGLLLGIFFLGNMLPQESLAYPLYYISRQLGVYDTRWPVIVIFIVIQSAFGTYLLTSVMRVFPKQILEAAAIDGAGRWTTLWRIVAPVSRPTLSVMFVFFFIWTWNEFFIPLIFLVSESNQTVPVALALLQGQHLTDVTTSSAASLLGVVPAIIFFLLFQRTLVRGFTAGAVK